VINRADAVFWVRQGEEIVYASPTGQRFWGSPVSRFTDAAKEFIDAALSEDRDKVATAMQAERSHPGSLDCVFRIAVQNGTLRLVHVTSHPLVSFLDRANVTLGVAVDVTAHRETLASLENTEDQFRLIAENTSDGLVVLEHGRIVYTSPAYHRQLGYSIEEEIGRTEEEIIALIHPDDRERTVSRILAAIDEGRDDLIYEYRARRRDGDYLWREDHARFQYDSNGDYVGAFIICRDISERKGNEKKIYDLAYSDPLTGLPNRNHLNDHFAELAPTSSDAYAALALCDLDDFHLINDTKGHGAGDEILQIVAKRLEHVEARCSAICRMGGDEFALVMRDLGTDKKRAEERANALIEATHHDIGRPFRLTDFGAEDFDLGVSTGYVLFRDHSEPLSQLLRHAEIALYTAKQNGKNHVRRYNSALASELEHKVRRIKQLRDGLANGELSLFFQPQIDRDGSLTGAEALLRWQRPDEGFVSPAEFIPLAEEAGLMVDIGQWVLESACETLSCWRGSVLSELDVSINVSVSQFLQEDFERVLVETVNRHGIKPERLKLEITESLLIDRPEKTESRIRSLQRAGFRFSIDDFGTGYSALSYFCSIPFDEVKIDQGFVRRMQPGSRAEAIVRTILELGRRLEIDVVAEGVETAQHQAQLAELGCRQFQGYLFSRPLPVGDFGQWATSPDRR